VGMKKIRFIFGKIEYILLTICVAIIVYLGLTFVSAEGAIGGILGNPEVSLFDAVSIYLSIPYGYFIERTPQALILLIFALLFGVNTTMAVHYFRMYRATSKSLVSALMSGSFASVFLGIGCVSCGSLIIGFVASTLGISGVILNLPFGGSEFGLLSIVLLIVSILVLYRRMPYQD